MIDIFLASLRRLNSFLLPDQQVHSSNQRTITQQLLHQHLAHKSCGARHQDILAGKPLRNARPIRIERTHRGQGHFVNACVQFKNPWLCNWLSISLYRKKKFLSSLLRIEDFLIIYFIFISLLVSTTPFFATTSLEYIYCVIVSFCERKSYMKSENNRQSCNRTRSHPKANSLNIRIQIKSSTLFLTKV